jgi:hypothetical protein
MLLNIPKVSTCVLESIDVNYAPNDVWSTYDDGMPTAIALQLHFKDQCYLLIFAIFIMAMLKE